MKHALSLVLLLALPASATIMQQQSAKNFTTCSASSCQIPFTNKPQTGDLFVVWTFWQSASTFTASVTDILTPPSTFVSAVGPTLQAAASTPISAQIFYAKDIQNTGNNPDTVSVTFSGTGTITAAGAVIVEYSGADIYNPLDSVSAGYSTSGNPTSLLDSGTVAPANANLLVFGGGTSDNTALPNPGGGFTLVQSNSGSTAGSLTEQMIVSANNTLQRATAGYSTLPPPSGNWVMQMAVFRDASWTVGGGWTPVRPGQVLDASQFPGTDLGAKITSATAALPSTGGDIHVPVAGTTSSALSLGASTQPVYLHFGTGSVLTCNLTSSGNCLKEGTDSRLSGEGPVGTYNLSGSSTFNATSLITNTSSSEFFQFRDFAFQTATGGTYSNAAMDIEGGFVPSFIDNVIGVCAHSGTCLRLTTGTSTGESAGDYSINESWFNCVSNAGCAPLSVVANTAGNHTENITLRNSAFEHPGTGVYDVSLDGTTGGILNFNFIADRFEGNSTDTTRQLVNLNNVDSAHFLYPWFAPLAALNPPWVNIAGSMSMFTMLGGQSGTTGGIVNNITRRTLNGFKYIPIYIYAADTIPGVIEMDPFIFSSPGDKNLAFHFNSGATATHETDVTWDDQNVQQWDWQKANNNNFQLLDSANSSRVRLGFVPNGHTNIDSGAATAINLNMDSNSGTGGVVFGSGGATPSSVATVDANGNAIYASVSSGATTNAKGLQMFNSTTTCTTGAAVGDVCTTSSISLPVGYSDTNYRASCVGLTPTNVPIVETVTKSNTSLTITIAALTASAATFASYDCIVGHN